MANVLIESSKREVPRRKAVASIRPFFKLTSTENRVDLLTFVKA
jgi:hypothetical protein